MKFHDILICFGILCACVGCDSRSGTVRTGKPLVENPTEPDPFAPRKPFYENYGWTPEKYFPGDADMARLCKAIERNDMEVVRKTIADGVNVRTVGVDNMTPLMWTFPSQSYDIFEALLDAGADPNVRVKSDLGTRKDTWVISEGDCVTSLVACKKDLKFLECVMKHGGDPTATKDAGRLKLQDTMLETIIRGNIKGEETYKAVQLPLISVRM
jgi:FOG: Ankyrin repeat